MATQIGPKIGIEGEKEYRAALQQIINETKNLDAAMQKTASEWTVNTSAMTKNKAAAQNLIQKIDLQKEKLSIMNQMLEKSAEKYGENADATKSWQKAVDLTTASLNKMESELKGFNGAEGFSDLSTRFADIGTAMQNVGAKMTAVGQRLTASLTLPIAAAGAAAVKLASDTEEAANKVDVVFGTMAEDVRAFADISLESYGLAEGSALQMAGTFGAMATSMGLSQAQAAKMSTSLTALAADMASFYNVSTEVAQTSLQGVFTGETEALKKFGIVMTQTNLEAFAAQQGKVYSQMSEGEKVMTRYAFVMDATKDAQGDFGRTSDGTANSLRTFGESLKELGAAFGEQILPIITPIIQKMTDLIKKLSELPPGVQKVIVVLALIIATVGPLLVILGTLMSSFGAIIANAPAVAAAFSKIALSVAGLAASLGVTVPILLAIVAAAAAVGVAVGYIAANWDEITAAVEDMVSGIKGAVSKLSSFRSALADLAADMARGMLDKIKELPEKIAAEISQAIAKLKEIFSQMVADAKQSGKDMVEGFVDGIKSKVQKVIDSVKKIAQSVKDFLGFSEPDKGPLSDFHTFAPDMMKLFAQGINQNKGIVLKALDGLAKEIALPLDSGASMNLAIAGADGGYSMGAIGGTTMNVYVDHINDLQDLINIQNQAQQRYRMGAR